jgi:hypothetical protein
LGQERDDVTFCGETLLLFGGKPSAYLKEWGITRGHAAALTALAGRRGVEVVRL